MRSRRLRPRRYCHRGEHRGLDTRPDGRNQYGRRPLRTNQTDIRPNLAALRQKNGDREKQRKRKCWNRQEARKPEIDMD